MDDDAALQYYYFSLALALILRARNNLIYQTLQFIKYIRIFKELENTRLFTSSYTSVHKKHTQFI